MKLTRFLAILLTALGLMPGAAHVLEIAHKLSMDRSDYLVTQSLYRGWAWLGALLVAAFIAVLALAFESRNQTTALTFAIGAVFSVAASFVIFFVWTYPVNRATHNWTVAPDNWQALRSQWELSHAANATVMLVALCLTVLAVITARARVVRRS